jgi:hypothetical protein
MVSLHRLHSHRYIIQVSTHHLRCLPKRHAPPLVMVSLATGTQCRGQPVVQRSTLVSGAIKSFLSRLGLADFFPKAHERCGFTM